MLRRAAISATVDSPALRSTTALGRLGLVEIWPMRVSKALTLPSVKLSCLRSSLSRFCVADSAEIDRPGGRSHGAHPRAVPEGAERSGVRGAVWHGGQVPGCGDGRALAERL